MGRRSVMIKGEIVVLYHPPSLLFSRGGWMTTVGTGTCYTAIGAAASARATRVVVSYYRVLCNLWPARYIRVGMGWDGNTGSCKVKWW